MTSLEGNMTRPHVMLFMAFMVILLPVYYTKYTAKNFLYICDLALLVTMLGFMMENEHVERLLLSSALSGILIPQTIWCVDFLLLLFDQPPLTGMSEYMFNRNLPLYLRCLSFFHFWLPWFLIYSLWPTRFERDGWIVWTGLATIDLLICYWVSPPPGGPPELPRNINNVFGLDDEKSQSKVNPIVWTGLLILMGPLCVYYPAAVLLDNVFRLSG